MNCDICKKTVSLYVLRKPFLLCKYCAEKIEKQGDWREENDL